MANRLRIAHVDTSRTWRGGQQQLLLLMQGLRELECEQVLVVDDPEVARRFASAGFQPQPRRSAARAAAQADIVHAHDGRAHGWMLRHTLSLKGRGARPARVLSRRVAYPIRGWGSRWKYRRLDLVLAVSEFVRARVLAALSGSHPGGRNTPSVAVVPDGIDLGTLPAPPEADAIRTRVRSQCGIPPAANWLLCLGAFTPEKGVEDAVAALARLGPDARLILTGSGPGEAALRRQARDLRVEDRVHFVADARLAPLEWTAASDLLLMPSHAEGLGSAALLAMALHRPVVASAVGGIPEVVRDQDTGLLTPDADPPALAAACRRLLDDPELREQLCASARTQVETHYDSRRLAARCLERYETLASGRRPSPAASLASSVSSGPSGPEPPADTGAGR